MSGLTEGGAAPQQTYQPQAAQAVWCLRILVDFSVPRNHGILKLSLQSRF